MALTEKGIQNSQPRSKAYKLYDGNGLLLRVKPNGTKIWEFKYRYFKGGKKVEKMLSIGVWDEVSLKDARAKCVEAKKLMDENKDPAAVKQQQKVLVKANSNNSFEAVARNWHELNIGKWTKRHAAKLLRRLELHIFPGVGGKPVAEISALEVVELIRVLEKENKTETTHKILQDCRAVFQHAFLHQKIQFNPLSDLRGLLKPHVTTNHPTLSANQIPAFLTALDAVQTTPLNRLAVKLLMHTFVRQGELRKAKWSSVDWKQAEWRIPPENMKMKQEHIVPLSTQVVGLLRELQTISGEGEFLFPSQNRQKNPFMSENTINKVIHDMDYKGQVVGHGFRAMASTILNEAGYSPDVIERQLAHMPRNRVRAAYNRAQYLDERRKLMQAWSDYLTAAAAKGESAEAPK